MVLAARAQPVTASAHFWVEGLYQLVISQHGLQAKAAAEADLRLAIDLSISRFGARDARARNWLVGLGRWLRDEGRLVAAGDVQARREGMIQPTELV